MARPGRPGGVGVVRTRSTRARNKAAETKQHAGVGAHAQAWAKENVKAGRKSHLLGNRSAKPGGKVSLKKTARKVVSRPPLCCARAAPPWPHPAAPRSLLSGIPLEPRRRLDAGRRVAGL